MKVHISGAFSGHVSVGPGVREMGNFIGETGPVTNLIKNRITMVFEKYFSAF